jgi:hypothetical protein
MDRAAILSDQFRLSLPVGLRVVLMYSTLPKTHIRDGIAAGSDKRYW